MIDPKLNEIPVTSSALTAKSDKATEPVARQGREGLSIRDTVAGDTLMSVGARGVDTSGLRTGTGAGGGTSFVTPTTDASPAPSIQQGPNLNTGAQATIRQGDTGLPGTGHTDTEDSSGSALRSSRIGDSSDLLEDPTWDEISVRAYTIWCDQGCPSSSSENDWHRAVEELRLERRSRPRTSAASA